MSSTFFNNTAFLHDAGFSFIPCDGKKPCLRSWKNYQEVQPSQRVWRDWCEQYSAANIGLLTGSVNNICVIDCDDAERSLKSLYKEFGETPLVVKTSRG